MMQLQMNLEGVQAEGEANYSRLPQGDYNMKIVSSEVKETAKGGHMLTFDLEVLDGPEMGKKIIERLNIVNANPEAEKIGKERLKGILEKGGHKNPNFLADSDEMVGLCLSVFVIDSSFTTDAGVEVTNSKPKSYKAVSQAGIPIPPVINTPPVPAAPVATPAAAPVSGGALPWNK